MSPGTGNGPAEAAWASIPTEYRHEPVGVEMARSGAAGSVWTVNLSDYQRRSRATAVYPDAGANLTYPALGLCGEAGEAAEKVKKTIRDDGGVLTDERRDALAAELGDVLWYVAQLATEAGLDLDEVAESNLEKLLSRRERAVLHGSGDFR